MKNKEDNPSAHPDALSILKDRQCVRAFLPQIVSDQTITRILDAARFAPSGVNTQPWKVAVLGPIHRQKISQGIIHALEQGLKPHPDYDYYPKEWVEPYKSRRQACGLALYGALDIKKEDLERRKQQWYRNYYFFDAPAALIFYIDAKLCKGSWMDMGMFIQNVMLAARAFDLETCPQAALAEFPDIIRETLDLPVSQHIVCGMAMGHPDWSNPINQYRTTREEVNSFTRWYT